MKFSNEFKVGEHGIGYVSNDFTKRFAEQNFEESAVPPRAITLPRHMTDTQIESELKPGYCTLGDVLAVIESGEEKYKDGNWNLFYFEACVVGVYWRSFDGGWVVSAWDRDGHGWSAGNRVFSPAAGLISSITSDLTLESLDARVRKIEYIINPDLLNKI